MRFNVGINAIAIKAQKGQPIKVRIIQLIHNHFQYTTLTPYLRS